MAESVALSSMKTPAAKPRYANHRGSTPAERPMFDVVKTKIAAIRWRRR